VRILQVNAFHYLRGGVERATFDEARWLEAGGHRVDHLATRDPRNLASPTAQFFAPPADFGEHVSWARRLSESGRMIWSRPAAESMERLLAAERPDVAHVHAPSRYLTPSVLRPLERARVPTVMTLHDFKPWCTNRVMFARGAACERCRGGRHWHAVTVGCVQDSRVRSAAAALEAYVHDALDAYRWVGRWIAPSRFVADKAAEHGLARSVIREVVHGVEARPAPSTSGSSGANAGERYALYAGRLSPEKGVELLPDLATRIAPIPLLVAGDGPSRAALEAAARTRPGLRLLGHLSAEALAEHLANAAVVLIPSLFYETFCYAVAEALALERPVVASRIGAIPELIEHEATGLLVPPGDPDALANATRRALEDPAAAGWARVGAERVRTHCDPLRHVEGLLSVYREAIDAVKPAS
jgi:glycosyltransferase involved in cell wall biosynthesis